MRRSTFIAALVALACASLGAVSTACAAPPVAPTVTSTIPEDGYHSPISDPVLIGESEPGTTVEFFTENADADPCGTLVGSGTAAELAHPGITVHLPRIFGGWLGTPISARSTRSDGERSACAVATWWLFDEHVPVFPRQGRQTGHGNRVLLYAWSRPPQHRYVAYADDPTCSSTPVGELGSVGDTSPAPFLLTVPAATSPTASRTTDIYVTSSYREHGVCPAEPQLRYTQLPELGAVSPDPSPTPAPGATRVPGTPTLGHAFQRGFSILGWEGVYGTAAEDWQPGDTIEAYGNATCSGPPLSTAQVIDEPRFTMLVAVPVGVHTPLYARTLTAEGLRSPCPETPQYLGVNGSLSTPTPQPTAPTPSVSPSTAATVEPAPPQLAPPAGGSTPASDPPAVPALTLSTRLPRCTTTRASRSKQGIPFAYAVSSRATLSVSLARKRSSSIRTTCPKRIPPISGRYGAPLTPRPGLVGLASAPRPGGATTVGGLRSDETLAPGLYRVVTTATGADGMTAQRVDQLWVLTTRPR